VDSSFFQSVCVLGYCAFPLVVSAFIALFFPLIILRGIVCGLAFGWSLTAAMGFLSDAQLDNRRLLALYPMGLFYFVIAWMVRLVSYVIYWLDSYFKIIV
jgi:xanthine/uracil permease